MFPRVAFVDLDFSGADFISRPHRAMRRDARGLVADVLTNFSENSENCARNGQQNFPRFSRGLANGKLTIQRGRLFGPKCFERNAEFFKKELRLFPRRKVSAFVHLVEVKCGYPPFPRLESSFPVRYARLTDHAHTASYTF